jgi:hypothetical protein
MCCVYLSLPFLLAHLLHASLFVTEDAAENYVEINGFVFNVKYVILSSFFGSFRGNLLLFSVK